MRRLLVGLWLVGTIPVALSQTDTVWDTRIRPSSRDNFIEAEFRLWIDGDRSTVGPLRALIVLAPGWNGDGRGLVSDVGWRALARELDAGLIGVCLRSGGKSDEVPYHRADLGSGQALAKALHLLAGGSGHPEVEQAPWLVWGHSAGGQWGYGLACVYPEKTAAFVAVKGGIYETPYNPSARGVPGLFVIGERDAGWRAQAITDVFERGRSEGAAWVVSWEQNSGHEVGDSVRLARTFFKEAFGLRVRPSARTGLRQLVVGEGVIGKRADYSTTPEWPDGESARLRTVWLPGPKTVAEWRRLGMGSEAGTAP